MSKVTITVSGRVGSGKSALCGEIEILCKALGLKVEWTDGQQEKNLTHADWTEALEMYKPEVAIVEQIERSAVVLDDERAAFEKWCIDYFGNLEAPVKQSVLGRDLWDAWQARAASPQATCQTCNGHGMIGGPSYREPDEGGEPCPDCAAAPQPAQTRALTQDLIKQIGLRYGVPHEDRIVFYADNFTVFAESLILAAHPASGEKS